MFSLVVAYDENRLIGIDNKMPWHYASDLKYFRALTLGKKLVMGLNTFYSIIDALNKPFDNRYSIVVSDRKLDLEYDNVEVANDLEQLIAKYQDSDEEVFVVGGMSIYEQMLEHCSKLYITHIAKAYDGDAYFPEVDFSKFDLVFSRSEGELTFCVYERQGNV